MDRVSFILNLGRGCSKKNWVVLTLLHRFFLKIIKFKESQKNSDIIERKFVIPFGYKKQHQVVDKIMKPTLH